MSAPKQQEDLVKSRLKLDAAVPCWYFLVPALAIAYTAVIWPLLSASNELFPYGIDTMGHLTKVAYMAERWRNLQFSDWFPGWYAGATVIQYYPPLSVWVGALVQMLTGNIMLTFKILIWSCLFLGGIFTAKLSKKLGGDDVAALCSAFLYTLGHYTLFTVFNDGTLGRAIAIPLYPLLFYQMLGLGERPAKGNWFYCSLLIALMILAHAMHAYLLCIGIGLFYLIWCLQWHRPWNKVVMAAEVILVGVTLTGFWSVPGVTQWETSGVPWLPAGIAQIFVIKIRDLLVPSFSPVISFPAYALALLGALLGLCLVI
jgi:uncharacterized membrane protein